MLRAYDTYYDFLTWLVNNYEDFNDEYFAKAIKIPKENYELFSALFHSGGVEIYDSKNVTENTCNNVTENTKQNTKENIAL